MKQTFSWGVVMMDIIKNAVQTGALVKVIYCSDTGIITERIIRIISVKQGYIQTFCFNKRQYRTFKESNILAIKLIRVTRGGTYDESA